MGLRRRAGHPGRGRLGAGHPRRAPHAEPHLPWWAVALGFACAEICVVHVRFRRSAHSFSLADLPFVFGLVFATGDAFVLGALVGTGIVWGLIRRLELVKLVFNLAQLALAATLAAGMLQLVAGNADALQPETWVGLYAATLASGALTILLLGGAIAIAEGNAQARRCSSRCSPPTRWSR